MNGFAVYAFSLYVMPLNAQFGWNRATIMGGYMATQILSGLASLFAGRLTYR